MSIFYTYIYFDPRPHKNWEPIYVGKGKDARYLAHIRKKTSNVLLKNKLKKIQKCGLEPKIILYEAKDENFASSLEIWFIYKFGRIDNGTGTLCNHTDGGDGTSGWICSDETRSRMSKSSIGKKISDETKAKISSKNKGRKPTDVERERMSKAGKGRHKSDAHKTSIKQSLFGKSKSEGHRKSMCKKRSLVTCPYCQKSGGSNCMARWHFDRCKMNPNFKGEHIQTPSKEATCQYCGFAGKSRGMGRFHFENCKHKSI